MQRIDTKTGRDRLPSRREPYWLRLSAGRYLGFRKTPDSGFWVARYRDGAGAQKYSALGEVSATFEYDEAKKAAERWIGTLDKSGAAVVKTGTVAAACEAYAAKLETLGRTSAATEARARFKQTVNDDRLGTIRLDALTRDDVEGWRDRLVTDDRTRAAVNRHLRTLKAALNEALAMGFAGNPLAWQTAHAFSNADGRRDVFLTLKQRRALLEAAAPALRAFLTGLLYTGARPGELARATVADFNAKQGNVTVRSAKGRGGKVRPRSVPLTPAGVTLFKAAAKSKLPAAPLFSNPEGGAWTNMQLSRAIRATVTAVNSKAKENDKLPAGICGYTFRHTAISEQLAAGINPVTVAQMAGTSVLMIEKHYHKFIAAPALDKLAALNLV